MHHRISTIKCTDFTLCISNDYNIYSFGTSLYGSHGHKIETIKTPKQIDSLINIYMIDCATSHTICLNNNGDVFFFGEPFKKLKERRTVPKTPPKFQTHIPFKLNLPPCKQISCGSDFSVFVTQDNELYSLHRKYSGMAKDSSAHCSDCTPQLLTDLKNIDFIECGANFILCKTFNNELYSWGYNDYGQLGQGNTNNCNKPIQCLNWPDNIIDIKCGKYHSLLLTSEGQVYSFGRNTHGQLGINDEIIKSINIPTLIKDIPEIKCISCGSYHSMCIDINNKLWLFGDNSNGQLGLGDKNNRYKPILHPTLSNIINISSGGNHTFAKTIDNKIYAFGNNKYSQLGIKTFKSTIKKPKRAFKKNEDIWCTPIMKSRAKSARK